MASKQIQRDLLTTTAQLSQLLGRYANLASSGLSHGRGTVNETFRHNRAALEGELEGVFEQFQSQIDAMQQIHSTSHPPPSTSAVHALERHRDVLADYRREFARTRDSIIASEQRANLLGSVREEINTYKSASASAATDALLNDRQHIDSSHRMIDGILNQSYATRDAFYEQRNSLQGIQSRMLGVTSQVPAINSIIGMINSRRRRDSLILGSVMGVCVVLLLWIMWR